MLPRLFYSRERIMTWEAKRAFVEPDLMPLPSRHREISARCADISR